MQHNNRGETGILFHSSVVGVVQQLKMQTFICKERQTGSAVLCAWGNLCMVYPRGSLCFNSSKDHQA